MAKTAASIAAPPISKSKIAPVGRAKLPAIPDEAVGVGVGVDVGVGVGADVSRGVDGGVLLRIEDTRVLSGCDEVKDGLPELV